MKMERTAEIIRGWPYDGALDRAETIKASVTLVNGDWVEKQSDGTVDKSSATATQRAGLVFAGNGDSGSASNSNKAVVLWGNFIARVSNYTAGAWAPNSPVTIKSGKVAIGVIGTDPIIGWCLDVVAVSATTTACIVVRIL